MKSKQLFLAATLLYFSAAFALSGMNMVDRIQSSSSNLYAESVYNSSTLAEQSDMVITGTVTDIGEARWAGSERPENITEEDVENIHHVVEIDVEEALKGEEKESLEVRVDEGKIDDYESISSTAPSFQQNEKVLLFLADMDRGYVVKGGEYGKLNTENGIIEREDVPEKYDQRLNLTELKDEIRSKYG